MQKCKKREKHKKYKSTKIKNKNTWAPAIVKNRKKHKKYKNKKILKCQL